MKILLPGNDGGWSNLEILVALFIILIGFSAIAVSAQQALRGSLRIAERAMDFINEKNKAIEAVLEIFNE
jgi:hypothetical protein